MLLLLKLAIDIDFQYRAPLNHTTSPLWRTSYPKYRSACLDVTFLKENFMFKPSRLFLILSLTALAWGTSACNDDPKDEKPNCEENPNAEGCEDTKDPCEEDPNAEGCEDTKDPCVEDPNAEGCNSNDDTCDDDAIEALMLEHLDLHDTAAETIPDVQVEDVDTVDGASVSNYRYLTFTLPSSGQPGSDVPDGSKLYLDIDNNTFLDISDEDALSNNDWDIAFDGKHLNYVYANSGHSGGFTGAWPSGIMVAELENIASEEAFLEIDATDTSNIPFGTEQWIDDETCKAKLTNWLPVLEPNKILPQTIIGSWYTYDMDGGHQMVPTPTAYAVYDSANRHHVYKIKFLSYNATSLEVKIAVQDQFQQNPCADELAAAADATNASDEAQASLPAVTVDEQDAVIWDGEDQNGDPIEVEGAYRKLSFQLPEATEGASKLYLSIQDNAFLDITDEEALGLAEDDEGEAIHNQDWDIAIDLETYTTYTRSGQSGGYPHLARYESGWSPRGMMAARQDGIEDEDDFKAWNSGADTSIYGTEDYIDIESAECAFDQDADGNPATIIGNDLLDVENNAAFGIYTSMPCHNVFQFKVLSFDEETGDVELGVILANPGTC